MELVESFQSLLYNILGMLMIVPLGLGMLSILFVRL
jgi:hypothetical protein